MTKIQDLFGDLALDKPITVEVEGKELELDMRVDDLHALMAMGQSEEVDEEEMEKLTDTLRNILYRSYLPHYDKVRDQVPDSIDAEQEAENKEAKEYIEGVILRNYLDLFVGISSELGWQDEMDSVPGQAGNLQGSPQS